MIPSASQVMARRWWARLCVRGVALVALLWGLAGGFGAASGTAQLMSQLGQFGVGQLNVFAMVIGVVAQAVMPLGVAATLIWFERRIVRWLVPIPSYRCPRCDYSLIGVHEPRCPECGLPLDEAITGPQADQLPLLTPPPARPSPTVSSAASPRRETRRPDPE